MTRIHDLTVDLAKAGKTCKEIKEIVEAAYPGQSLARSTIFRIIKTMKEGGDVSDKRGLDTTKTVRTPGFIDAVRIAIESDRKLTISQLVECHRASRCTILKILTEDLGLRKKGDSWVPVNSKKTKIPTEDIKCEVDVPDDDFDPEPVDKDDDFEKNLKEDIKHEIMYDKNNLAYASKSEHFSPEDSMTNNFYFDSESKSESLKFEDDKKNAKLEFDNYSHSSSVS
eukprot:TRINITY_DN2421_c0_g1_i1.p1 TRINITY_DN2421_c0_g1~~TRINITY_DN2421_c0_g1_i1.p1  ORF type:complete len:226 (-),score=61.33 TRINITY_DN2421_c0_g1_i1:61-738(-)